jgi:hypothetical protein
MPQISLYVRKESLKKYAAAARQEKKSVSNWACEHLDQVVASKWPPNYFKLFGCIKDPTFKRPPQGSFADDLPRKSL